MTTQTPIAPTASNITAADTTAADTTAADTTAADTAVGEAAIEPSPMAALEVHLRSLSDDVLEKHLVELRREINAGLARFTLAVRELDGRIISDLDGLTTVSWLREFCQMTATEASGAVKTAWAMSHMPTTTDRALDGAIPPRSLQLLGQALDRNGVEFSDHESAFGDMASRVSVTDLRDEISQWEQQANFQRAIAEVDYQERIRSLYLTPSVDGMGELRGTLQPELFHLVSTVIDAKVNPTFLDDDDGRSVPQRCADALGDICAFYADHNDDIVTSGGTKPHVTVTVEYETLKGAMRRLPEIDGKPVAPETIRRLTCDAEIIPMVLGSDSEPLDVGRKTRTIPAAIRRAIEHRDEGCTWNGCGAPLSWCDAHHLIHWADGGDTSASNLKLLCRRHHTATHGGQRPPPDT